MTVASQITDQPYTANGSSTQFSFPNKIFAGADLVVVLTDLVGNLYFFVGGPTTFTNSATGLSYTVSNIDVDTGALVTFSAPPTNGWKVDIRSVTPEIQSTSVKNQGQFLPELHEEAFDRATRMIQDLLRLTYTYGIHSQDIETAPWPALPNPASRRGMALVFDLVTGLPVLGIPVAGTITGSQIATLLNPVTTIAPTADKVQTAAEIAASVTPVNYAYQPITPPRYGALVNGSADDTTAINNAIAVAEQTISGAIGNVVNLTLGTSVLSSEVTLPDDVRFLGTNKNGSIFQASGTWNSGTSPFMFHAVNGGSSMFDSLLESLTIDCKDIAGLGCVQSNAWQENCGPRRCLFYRYTTNAILVAGGDGGASFFKIEDCEFFASTVTATTTADIQVNKISSAGSFMLTVRNVSIAGNVPYVVPRGIAFVNDSSSMDTVHFEYHTTGVYLDGVGSHVLSNLTGGPGVTNLVEIAATFQGSVRMLGCRRAGATNLILDHRVGGLGSVPYDLPDVIIATSEPFAQAISGISQAASAVVTLSSPAGTNPVPVGAQLTFGGVTGMTQINGLQGTVSAIGGVSGAWTATVNINSSAFSAYTGPSGSANFPPNCALESPNAAKMWCEFDGTKTGTNAPNAGFNVLSITRNSAGNYTVTAINGTALSLSAISVTAGHAAYSVQDLGGGGASRQFIVNVLSVSGGVLVATPTDDSSISFAMFGNGL